VYLFIYYTLFIEEAYLAYFTTLIYHKVLINNKTEHDTEQDKQTKIQIVNATVSQLFQTCVNTSCSILLSNNR